MAVGTEFIFYMVELAVRPVIYRTLVKTSEDGFWIVYS